MRKVSKIVKEWLDKAEEDFGFAFSCLNEEVNYFAPICFHLHQAAEKYLKAFIIANDLKFKPVHNLLELLNICAEREPKIKELEQACKYLNPFYIDTRYPVHWPTRYNKKIAQEAMDEVSKIRNWIKNYLLK